MYFSAEEVNHSIQTNDSGIRNFFNTFGFCVIRNFYSKEDYKTLTREYDRLYALRLGHEPIWKMLANRLGFLGPRRYGFRAILKRLFHLDGMRFFPNFVDSSEVFSNFFFNKKRIDIYKYFTGENFFYLGSDGSHFFTSSFPWHRDWFTALPLLKVNSYFVKFPFFGGRFLIIPGSNRTCDSYAQNLQKCMSWPMQNKKPSGLSENGFLPPVSNPRDGYYSRFKEKIRRFLGLKVSTIHVPHIALKLGRRDLLFFDHRSIHCVETNFPNVSRRLLTMLVSKNPYDFPENHYLFERGYTKDGLLREVVDLVVNERNHIGIPAYGDVMKDLPFAKSKHFLKIDKVENGSPVRYNRGTLPLPKGKVFTSVLDELHYANIGINYRTRFDSAINKSPDPFSQAFGYGDVHTGINSQRITTLGTE